LTPWRLPPFWAHRRGRGCKGNADAGDEQIAAEFAAGRFDDFLDTNAAREPCAGVTLAPIPELEQLKP
jgi:hypothetical protein